MEHGLHGLHGCTSYFFTKLDKIFNEILKSDLKYRGEEESDDVFEDLIIK